MTQIINFPESGLDDTKYVVVSNCKIKIPLYNYGLSAGIPSDINDDGIEDYLSIDELLIKNVGHTYALRVSGTSMDPELHHKQLIIVDSKIPQNSTLEQLKGKIIVAILNGSLTLKRLDIVNNIVYLVPENPTFNRIKVKESDDFRVQAVLTYAIKSY